MNAIDFVDVSKSFGKVPALSRVTFGLAESECLALLARNGEGKSTCLKLILGLLAPDSGSIRLRGKNPRSERGDVLRSLGAIVDFPRLYPNLTATEFLRICSSLKGISGRHEIERVLRFVELGDSASRQIEKYSLGMKQRLALASAILGNPGILILDEPLNGLDVQGVEEMVSLLARLRSLRENTIVMAMHQLEHVRPIADKVAVISKSKLVYSGPPPSLGSCCVFDIGDSTAFIALLVEVGHGGSFKDLGEGGIEVSGLDRMGVAELVARAAQREIAVYGVRSRSTSVREWFVGVTS